MSGACKHECRSRASSSRVRRRYDLLCFVVFQESALLLFLSREKPCHPRSPFVIAFVRRRHPTFESCLFFDILSVAAAALRQLYTFVPIEKPGTNLALINTIVNIVDLSIEP